MKAHLLGILSVFAVTAASAQNIIIKDGGGNTVNGQTITIGGSSADTKIAIEDIDVYNMSGTSMSVKCKRYELSVQTGTGNSFCWAVCFNEFPSGTYPVWYMNQAQPIASMDFFNSFTGDHYPHGIAGTNSYRYVFYDANNTNDSSYVDLVFDVALSTPETKENELSVSVFPNPATSVLNFNYTVVNENNNEVILYNTLGKEVKSIKLTGNEGNVKIDVTDLTPGIYFCALLNNNKAIITRKILVNR